ncbi:MAG: nucleotidyltransferase, partial [Micrococcales bacterium]
MDVELRAVSAFLAEHEPCRDMAAEEVNALATAFRVIYERRGTLLQVAGEPTDHVYVLRSGAVDIRDEDGLHDRREAGAWIGSRPVLTGEPAPNTAIAAEDCLLLVMPGAAFRELVERNPVFGRYFRERQAARLAAAVAKTRATDQAEPILTLSVSELICGSALTVDPGMSIRDVSKAMSQRQVSSAVIVDGSGAIGILTDRDLRNRVLASDVSPDDAVSGVMTPDPWTVKEDESAFDLMVRMVDTSVHHVPVERDGRILGVLSSDDLIRTQTSNPIHLATRIARENSLSGLVAASTKIGVLVRQLVNSDVGAEDIARVVTAMGDAIERRLLKMAEEELGPPPVPYCWVVLGSQARAEQGLGSDQDNALIIDDDLQTEGEPGEYAREYFMQLATDVSDGLHACGYTYCDGGVMATTPSWRQTLRDWSATFHHWMTRPEPQAVMNSTIFFDLRGVHGDLTLADRLQERITAQAPQAKTFQAHLAKHAVDRRPPIGFFRGFVLESEGEHADTFNLKLGGVAAVTELARVYALSAGVAEVNTHRRLSACADKGALSRDHMADLRDAFEFISYVRFRHQANQVAAGESPNNFVSPDELSSLERRHLRDVFQVVRR